MKKIRKIMVAIDLSEYSKDILEYAGFLAKTTESELVSVRPEIGDFLPGEKVNEIHSCVV